ncbi:MAG: tetratricopeptide repeat protein [Desulfomonilia bacterium]|jgi:hypothetical protein
MAKTTRKDLLKAPDDFITTAGSTVQWIKENPARFATLVAIVVVVFAVGIGFLSWKTGREHSAMDALNRAGTESQSITSVVENFADTRAGKLARLRLAGMAYAGENHEAAIQNAQEFINDWGRKDTFHWQGILILAAAHLDRQEPEKVLQLLGDAVESSPPAYRDQALFYQARALVALGRHTEARDALDRISDNYREIALPALASIEN